MFKEKTIFNKYIFENEVLYFSDNKLYSDSLN